MAIAVSAGYPLLILLVMFAFGLYTRRNIGWVALSLAWGALGYGAYYFIRPELEKLGIDLNTTNIIFEPLILQLWVALGVLFVISREKFDNLIDGAVYGFAAGIGYSTFAAILSVINTQITDIQDIAIRFFPPLLVFGTASAINGIGVTQFYFRHKTQRVLLLLSGLGAALGYAALFNLMVLNYSNLSFLPSVIAIGGITLMSLYITGQLRKILIQLGVEKRRADGLLEIVIPIGVELTSEQNYQKLLERMLVEAKNFCKADAGTLYLKKKNTLEFAVVRNDTLNISMGGASGTEIENLPPLSLYDDTGKPNHKNVATYAALTGNSINIEDAYENKDFDFTGTKEFDEQTGYTSVSFLTIPLKDSKDEVLGVLQLLNAFDSRKKQLVAFDKNLQQLMESFSSLASAALEGYVKEQSLRQEIQQLRIEIDHSKREKEVAEITDTSYFKEIKQKAQEFREKESTKKKEE
jgi:GAF domain-containing protein